MKSKRNLRKFYKTLVVDSFEMTGASTCVCDGKGYSFAKVEMLDSGQYKVRVLDRHRSINLEFIKGELHDEERPGSESLISGTTPLGYTTLSGAVVLGGEEVELGGEDVIW